MDCCGSSGRTRFAKTKGAGALWRIIYKYDGAALSMTYKSGLLHKPRRATIDRARADI